MTKQEILNQLSEAHKAAQGKGDQGAFDVWNSVAEILKAEGIYSRQIDYATTRVL